MATCLAIPIPIAHYAGNLTYNSGAVGGKPCTSDIGQLFVRFCWFR
jgi:hypothetical protein